jgi:multidrug efflux pump subunit AcrA (membrane-fusion protein)
MTSGLDGTVHDSTWRQIEEIVDRTTELSRSDLPPQQFYGALLQHALQAGAAVGGAVWTAERESVLRLEAQDYPVDGFFVDRGRARDCHQKLLAQVRSTGRHQSVTVSPADDAGRRSTRQTLIACPISLDGRVVGMLEVVQRSDVSPDAQRVFTEVLSTLCELAADYQRSARLRQLELRETEREQADRFCQEVHKSLNLDRTSYTLANEAKRLVGCDRVTVAVARGAGCRIRAISGLDTFDRRAGNIRLLERLIDRVCAIGEPLWFSGDSQELSPEMDTAVQQYVDAAHARTVTVIPLRRGRRDDVDDDTSQPLAALVFEAFTGQDTRDGYRQRVQTVCPHAASALHNAVTYDRLPGIRVLEKLAWLRASRTRARLILWGLPVLVAVALLIFVRADFFIRCDGRLRPQLQRRIFAPRDGQVEQLHVNHAQMIGADTVVATMRSSELDFEVTRVLGDLETTAKQYDAVKASRLGANPTSPEQRDEYARLTAEEGQLEEQLTNLEKQRDLLEAQRKELRVRSPIAGQVITWEVDDVLQRRPVKRGQVLMTVADVEGPWVLEIQVPDKHINYVQRARKELRPDLDVAFMLATEPGQTFHGRLDDIAAASEPDETQQLYVTAVVSLDTEDLPSLLPGAGVTARIYCGRRSIGYVWLHDLIEALRAKLFI